MSRAGFNLRAGEQGVENPFEGDRVLGLGDRGNPRLQLSQKLCDMIAPTGRVPMSSSRVWDFASLISRCKFPD